ETGRLIETLPSLPSLTWMWNQRLSVWAANAPAVPRPNARVARARVFFIIVVSSIAGASARRLYINKTTGGRGMFQLPAGNGGRARGMTPFARGAGAGSRSG